MPLQVESTSAVVLSGEQSDLRGPHARGPAAREAQMHLALHGRIAVALRDAAQHVIAGHADQSAGRGGCRGAGATAEQCEQDDAGARCHSAGIVYNPLP